MLIAYMFYGSMTYMSTGEFPDGLLFGGLITALAFIFGFTIQPLYNASMKKK